MTLSLSRAVLLLVAYVPAIGCEPPFSLATGGAGGASSTTSSVSGSSASGTTVAASTGANMQSTCDAKYGSVPGYVFCAVTADSCDFNVDTGATGTCAAACSSHGGACILAYDNETACTLKSSVPLACNDGSFTTTLCRCSLP